MNNLIQWACVRWFCHILCEQFDTMSMCSVILSFTMWTIWYNEHVFGDFVINYVNNVIQWACVQWFCHIICEQCDTMSMCSVILSYNMWTIWYNEHVFGDFVIYYVNNLIQWACVRWFCHLLCEQFDTMSMCSVILS